jgi:hypothetical protein
MDIFSSLPFPAGTANTPKNVIVVDVFYRAQKLIADTAQHSCNALLQGLHQFQTSE